MVRDARELRGAWATFQRHWYGEPALDLVPFVSGYWVCRWDLRGQEPYRQKIVPYPNVHLTFRDGDALSAAWTRARRPGPGRPRPGLRGDLPARLLPARSSARPSTITGRSIPADGCVRPGPAATSQARSSGAATSDEDRRRPREVRRVTSEMRRRRSRTSCVRGCRTATRWPRPPRPWSSRSRPSRRSPASTRWPAGGPRRAPAAAAVRRVCRRPPEVGDPPLPAARGERAAGVRCGHRLGAARRSSSATPTRRTSSGTSRRWSASRRPGTPSAIHGPERRARARTPRG